MKAIQRPHARIWTPDRIEQLKVLLAEGLKRHEIGAKMGFSPAAIQAALVRYRLRKNIKKKSTNQ